MLLLDTLYQHVLADTFPSEVRTEEKWMSEYRSRLCRYYDSRYRSNGIMSVYAKADSVLNEGGRLLELGNKWTTMDMIVTNDAELTFGRCREYGMLSQVISHCESEEAKELVYQEWAMYEKMLKKIGLLAFDMVSLNYWGGSIIGPAGTASYLKIQKSRIRMYKAILDIMEGEGWVENGVPMENAERYLFYSCSKAIDRIVKEDGEFFREYGGKESVGFYDTGRESHATIKEIRPIINKWVILMDKVDEELTHDSTRHFVERAAAYMLMQWASIITER